MKILGIETSCDETGIAIYSSKIIINKTFSQYKIHSKYGGVIPELASRNHIKNIIPLIKFILKKNNISKEDIYSIAYTSGPGLFSSLIIGATIGVSLSYAWGIKSIPINHLEGHIFSPFINNTDNIKFPFLALLISGGHTQLIKVYELGKYKIIGNTLDDSVGEVFDKIGSFLKLKYPGGPKISYLAKFGKLNKYKFPKPLIKSNNLNFSFSGLKTHIYNLINEYNNIDNQTKFDISLEFENTIIDILILKTKLALEKTNIKLLSISGGVISNIKLRNKFKELENILNIKVFMPNKELCTDNGAMIAYAGYLRYKNKKNNTNNNLEININSNWSIENTY